ncbi:hypothetical protein GCM10027058_00080 [Microbacterium neimengense]
MTMSTWWAIVPAAAAALLVLLGPGAMVLAPLRLPRVMRVALAGPTSVFLLGVAGIVFAAVGVPYGAWQPFALAVPVALLVFLLRTRAPRAQREALRINGAVVATWAAAAALMGVVSFAAVSSPDLISQTYDNVFHLSAIWSILEHGDASSLTLRTLIETDSAFGFYPAGWHALVASVVQLSGSSVAVAVNAVWLAVATALWLPGVVWLAQVILPRADGATVALVALPLGAVFTAMPYSLLVWGTLYPTFLATAALPAAIAAPIVAARRLMRPRAVRSEGWWAFTAVGVTAGAVAFGQPRVLASWALILLIPGVAAALGWARRGWRGGGARRARVVRLALAAAVVVLLGVVVAVWYVVVRLGLFTRPLDDRLGGPQARAVQSVGHGVWQVLAQSWPSGAGTVVFPALLLAVVMIVGMVALGRTRRTRWVVGAYLLVALLYVLAAGSDDVVTKLATALWYKDKYRLSSILPLLGVTLATAGVLFLTRRRRARPASERPRSWPAVVLAWVVAAASALGLAFGGTTSAVGDVFRMPAIDARGEVVSRAQINFFADLGAIVPPAQRVLGDPWDGSALTGVYGQREPVFPHVNGQWDADRLTLAWHLAEIGTNPEVCAALDRLHVRYVTYSPHEFGGGDPSGNHFPGPHQAVEAGLLTLVLSDGDTELYRIDQCGPLE